MKTREIIAGTILIIIGITRLCNVSWAEEYMVPDFNGGLNLATDGRDLDPNQSLDLTNWTLDTLGSLVPRQGFSYWDSAAIDINEEIETIYIYEPYEGDEQMFIATNSFLYIIPSLSDPGDVDWNTLRMGYSDDSLVVRLDSLYVRSIKANRYFYTNTEYPDILVVDGDTSGISYLMTPDSLSARRINLAELYQGADDTASYDVYAKIPSYPYLNQIGDKLYIFDDDRHALVYNDTNYWFLALIDSGTVTDTLTATTDSLNYRTGRVHFEGNMAIGDTNNGWTAALVGGILNFYGNVYEPTGTPVEPGPGTAEDDLNLPDDFEIPGYPETVTEIVARRWSSEITDYDSERNAMILKEPFPYVAANYWNVYSITYLNTQCNFDADLIISDTTKNWDDTKYGDRYLANFYAIFQGVGIGQASRIYCNDDARFQMNIVSTRPSPDSQYFIFSSLISRPTLLDSIYKLSPYLEQGISHFSELYVTGRRFTENLSYINKNRLWYSAEAMPFYMKFYRNSIDFDANEDVSVLSNLRGDVYIGFHSNIWRLSGTFTDGNNFLSKAVSNNGIPDIDNWVKATEEYAYFANRTGVYRFDGVRPQKISWDIDPVIRANYGSRIVMGYFPMEQKLFLSFPDSGITYFYDERFGDRNVWVGPWDFGMTCFYAPPDTNIFYFGHSEFKGRVYYYPNGRYQDIVAIDDTNDISVVYESGWQSYAGYWMNKKIGGVNQGAYFPVKNYNSAVIKLYTNNDNGDFNTIACDTVLCDSTGWFVYHKQFGNECIGEYFKTRFEATVDTSLIFGGYRYVWGVVPSAKK